jgi:hypothetical protein
MVFTAMLLFLPPNDHNTASLAASPALLGSEQPHETKMHLRKALFVP